MSSSGLDSVREEVTRQLSTALAASIYSDIAVWYPNRPIVQKDGTIWIRLTFIGGDGIQANLGPTAVERFVGIIQMEVVFPESSGTKKANDITDFLGKLFSRKQFYSDANNRVTCKVPKFMMINGVVDGTMRNIARVAYRRDECI
ncbi:MAG: phage tail terminator-like protein [Leifsonia sp.]